MSEPTLQDVLKTIWKATWLTPDRVRVLLLAKHAHLTGRIVIRHWAFGLHVTLDGMDVAALDGSDFACSTTKMKEAEELIATCRKVCLTVGGLKKELADIPDDASLCIMVRGCAAMPGRVIYCMQDNSVIIVSE